MSNRLIPTIVVLDRVCLSKTELYRRINLGEFSKPLSIGRHRVAFVEAEVAAWIADRMQARENDESAEARKARARHAVGKALRMEIV